MRIVADANVLVGKLLDTKGWATVTHTELNLSVAANVIVTVTRAKETRGEVSGRTVNRSVSSQNGRCVSISSN
jgi:hypothetical protein